MPRSRYSILALSASLVLLTPVLANAAPAADKSWDPIALRGYGTVEAQSRDVGAGRLLTINCETEDAARLLQAKFLSDLDVLPGVKDDSLTVGKTTLPAKVAQGQGWLIALRKGSVVHIAVAHDAASLASTLESGLGKQLARYDSAVEATVPMWLDRFDRHGFRFYYRAWETPNKTAPKNYDFLQEFAYAEQSDGAGFVFWNRLDPIDTAEGLTALPWWDWAFEQAKARNLPTGINITLNSRGSSWFFNRHRDELSQKMPQFSGNLRGIADPTNQANGSLSWSATDAQDEVLGWLQNSLRDVLKDSHNVTTILEPHDELHHGAHDVFMEYGPVADATWREFLKAKYSDIQKMNTRWGTAAASWDDVRVPEVAAFAGWDGGTEALDLTGLWKIGFEEYAEGKTYDVRELARMKKSIVETKPTPAAWVSPDFDDSAWPEMLTPGNDQIMFTPARPSIYRRSFSASPDWVQRHSRLWLYVWDLNEASGERFVAWMNGKKVGEDILPWNSPHWGAYEVTDAIKPGENQISLRLPRGRLAYRAYLSPVPPRQYPDLGPGLNAQWVDFVDWTAWTRADSVRRGMEAIRQVDPNIQIDLMAPDYYADEVKQLAATYGGNFKNTGHMGAFWADFLPSIMRGARLPFSLEPGWPAPDLTWFKKQFGFWSTEGIQGIDYFIHIGSILWKPELKDYFDKNLRQIRLVGKYHTPEAEVAALYPIGITAKTDFPWSLDLNTNLSSGYWKWNVRANLMGLYESDGLTESSFADGDAARYKVIIDTNTSIMDEALENQIERYVREGGTFVTFVQTGRHTPTIKDAWPISRLTGYEVTGIDQLDNAGRPKTFRRLRPAPSQELFTGDWSKVKANGLTLNSVAADTQDLMLWADGSTAIGMRPLGKGRIIQVGCKFDGDKMPDRLGSWTDQSQLKPAPSNNNEALTLLLHRILKAQGIATIPARISPANGDLRFRHYVSNNGLFDVWAIFNQSTKTNATGHIVFGDDPAGFPTYAHNVRDNLKESVTAEGLAFDVPPLEIRTWITPRSIATNPDALLSAPDEWFTLQRDWWRAAKPIQTKIPASATVHTQGLDLRDDWAFRSLTETPATNDILTWTASGYDDSAWERVRFGILTQPGRADLHHALLRKHFTVPADWTNGTPVFSVQSWQEPTFIDEARIWIDGQLIRDWSSQGLSDASPAEGFAPGSHHVVTIEIRSQGVLTGGNSNVWLWNQRKPEATLDLAGQWQPSQDMLNYEPAITLPGPYSAFGLRRTVTIPSDQSAREVYVDAITQGRIVGVLINGTFVRRFYHGVDQHMSLNITPWVKFGEENELQLVSIWSGPTTGTIDSVRIEFHDHKN
jgi:hypothetical protein